MGFNIIKFLKYFLIFTGIGFIIDIIFEIRFFSFLGSLIGAFIGFETDKKNSP